MLNVFLDSNILYSDPLMEKKHNKILFDKVNRVGGKIFICDVVYKETLNNYRKRLQEVKLEIDKLKVKLDKLRINTIDIQDIDVDAEVKLLEKKFEEYIRAGKYVNIEVNNDILPQVIDRAIKRKKPFSENKEEFRDCVIWLTYANKVESDNLDKCIFITANVSDFCDKKGELHKDLLKDTEKFSFHSNAYKFIEHESKFIDSLENEIIDKFKQITVEHSEFENPEIFHKIYSSLYSYLIGLSEEEVQDKFSPIYSEYIDLNSIDLKSIVKKNNDINIESLYISELGEIDIEASIDLKTYYDHDDYTVGSTSVIIRASYIAKCKIEDIKSVKVSKTIQDIELDNICIKEIHPDIFDEYYENLQADALADQMEALESYYNH